MIPVLHELYEETKRLAVAGSDLAAGDPKLHKIAAVLTKMGEKAPVFKQLAQMTELLANDREESAERLLSLSSLLHSVLYTQGTTGDEGEWEDRSDEVTIEADTSLSYRTIEPLLEALTSKGSGRLQVIEQAFQANAYHDLRLVQPLLQALDDSYPDIADFVAHHMLPSLGEAITPFLLGDYDLKGKRSDARRLEVLGEILREKGLELYREALSEGSFQVKIAAISILADYPDEEDAIMEETKAKKLEVRQAAYEALVKSSSEKAAKVILEGLSSKDNDWLIYTVARSKSPTLNEGLFRLVKEAYETYKEGETKESKRHLSLLLYGLKGKEQENMRDLLQEIAADEQVPSGIARDAVTMLLELKDEKNLLFVEQLCANKQRSTLVDLSFQASLQLGRTKEDVFDRYQYYVKKTRRDPVGKVILEELDERIDFVPALKEWDPIYRYYYMENSERNSGLEWDQRWLSLFQSLDEEQLVYRLSRSVEEESHLQYLLAKVKKNPYFSSQRGVSVILSLIQSNYEHTFDVMKDMLIKTDRYADSVKFHISSIVHNLELFAQLSPSYAGELEKVVQEEMKHPKLKDKMLEVVYEMKKREGVQV
ncbi:HEAT repeat domain-containing protein [Priestia koreensis]|uniref:HEAT repeat domain-containing protein n=1 Tax=Priestia koreensis TaxID=284581 RepID=UPI00203D1EEB|nr:HEAT repeat domain-containing protein [Priestia koreensis]MCM3005464.1 HEAT repeat domain-containing protein [Priestia koreensis]